MRLVLFCICFMVWLVDACHADRLCGAEIKLLLLPTEVRSALKALKAGRRTEGSVYFFDTRTLELQSQGVILRRRNGASSDLTVKLRPPANIEAGDGLKGCKRCKCEVDLTGQIELRSYSIQTKFAGA